MTHKDIYTKFMIEYDKANVTSSYPSLTEYEVATFLDKAYLALVWQKVTGNNIRKAYFESDSKSVSDVQPLIVRKELPLYKRTDNLAENTISANLPDDYFDFVQLSLNKTIQQTPQDSIEKRTVPVKLISHSMIEKFLTTSFNIPWIKNPVCCIDSNIIDIAYDSINSPDVSESDCANFIYIKRPISFLTVKYEQDGDKSYEISKTKNFELSDSMAEELINLAIAFALENIESTRLNSKLNTRGLEA